jgi:hypothetical protein
VVVSTAYFERFIARDQRALHLYFLFTLGVVALGFFLIVLSFLLTPSSASAELLLRLGGGFVASLAALPLREMIDRSNRIGSMRDVREMWRDASSADPPEYELLARIEDTVWQIYAARASG